MKNLLKKQYIFPLIYFIFVIICILLAFDYKGSLNSDWWLILSALTLPWSLIGFIFIWALIHGAGLELFTIMYLFFASINVVLIHRIFRQKSLSNKNLSIKEWVLRFKNLISLKCVANKLWEFIFAQKKYSSFYWFLGLSPVKNNLSQTLQTKQIQPFQQIQQINLLHKSLHRKL